jgi:hypothetical protein
LVRDVSLSGSERIDPREPWRGITIEFDEANGLAELVGDTLSECVATEETD